MSEDFEYSFASDASLSASQEDLEKYTPSFQRFPFTASDWTAESSLTEDIDIHLKVIGNYDLSTGEESVIIIHDAELPADETSTLLDETLEIEQRIQDVLDVPENLSRLTICENVTKDEGLLIDDDTPEPFFPEERSIEEPVIVLPPYGFHNIIEEKDEGLVDRILYTAGRITKQDPLPLTAILSNTRWELTKSEAFGLSAMDGYCMGELLDLKAKRFVRPVESIESLWGSLREKFSEYSSTKSDHEREAENGDRETGSRESSRDVEQNETGDHSTECEQGPEESESEQSENEVTDSEGHPEDAKTDPLSNPEPGEITDTDDSIRSVTCETLEPLVQMTDTAADLLTFMENISSGYLSELRIVDSVLASGQYGSLAKLDPELSRNLLVDFVQLNFDKTRKPKTPFLAKLLHDYNFIHGLVKTREVLLDCSYRAALRVLSEHVATHRSVVKDSYKDLLRMLEAAADSKDSHPKVQAVINFVHRIFAGKNPARILLIVRSCPKDICVELASLFSEEGIDYSFIKTRKNLTRILRKNKIVILASADQDRVELSPGSFHFVLFYDSFKDPDPGTLAFAAEKSRIRKIYMKKVNQYATEPEKILAKDPEAEEILKSPANSKKKRKVTLKDRIEGTSENVKEQGSILDEDNSEDRSRHIVDNPGQKAENPKIKPILKLTRNPEKSLKDRILQDLEQNLEKSDEEFGNQTILELSDEQENPIEEDPVLISDSGSEDKILESESEASGSMKDHFDSQGLQNEDKYDENLEQGAATLFASPSLNSILPHDLCTSQTILIHSDSDENLGNHSLNETAMIPVKNPGLENGKTGSILKILQKELFRDSLEASALEDEDPEDRQDVFQDQINQELESGSSTQDVFSQGSVEQEKVPAKYPMVVEELFLKNNSTLAQILADSGFFRIYKRNYSALMPYAFHPDILLDPETSILILGAESLNFASTLAKIYFTGFKTSSCTVFVTDSDPSAGFLGSQDLLNRIFANYPGARTSWNCQLEICYLSSEDSVCEAILAAAANLNSEWETYFSGSLADGELGLAENFPFNAIVASILAEWGRRGKYFLKFIPQRFMDEFMAAQSDPKVSSPVIRRADETDIDYDEDSMSPVKIPRIEEDFGVLKID